MVREDLFYTEEHQWLKADGTEGEVGVTHYAQEAMGEVNWVELPEPGAEFSAGEPFGSIESIKSVFSVYCPVDLKVAGINEELLDNPGLINKDPYGSGWLIKVEIKNPDQTRGLMRSADYQKLTG